MKIKWFSKTIWFNGLALVVMVAGLFGFTGQVTADAPAWAGQGQEAIRQFGPWIVVLGNIVLRFLTKEALVQGKAA